MDTIPDIIARWREMATNARTAEARIALNLCADQLEAWWLAMAEAEGFAVSVGYGCSLCVRDGELLVCTERCDSSTPGYTETERVARLAAEDMAEGLAAAVTANARLLAEIPRCPTCDRYPIDHRGGVCIYPPVDTTTIL